MANENIESHPQTGSTSTNEGRNLLLQVTQPSKNKRLVWSALSESEGIPQMLSKDCAKQFCIRGDE